MILLLLGCIISILILVFLFIYFYSVYMFGYWKRCGVPYLTPKFPLGNNDSIGFEATSYGIETVEWYNEIKRRSLKYAGVWTWSNPVLLLTDIDYIKDVLSKNFNHFSHRDFYHNPKNDPKAETLMVLKDDKWKSLRQKLTPAFTSIKIKSMFAASKNYTEPMLEYLEEFARDNKDINILEVVASFTIDVIGGIALGLEFNSSKSKEKQFLKMGKEYFTPTKPSPSIIANLLLSRMYPKLAQYLGVTNVPAGVKDLFASLLIENLKFRKENNIKTADIIQLLIDHSEEDENFNFDDLVANVLGTFIAGFETSSAPMNMALYELSRNPDIQEKVRAEIQSEFNKNDGELTYESLQNMTYLRQVIDESLRMWPVAQNLTRVCVKPYTFPGTNYTMDKGISVLIPVLAISRDPEHYPDPEKFDPERFNAENKAKRNSASYLPFGDGPRNCIGKRLGLLQVSIGLVELLRNYRFTISPNTKMPLTLKRNSFLLRTNETLYLRAEKL